METVDYQEFHDAAKELMEFWCPTKNSEWVKVTQVPVDESQPWKGLEKVPVAVECRIIFLETRDRVEEFNITQYIPETELVSDSTFAIFHPQGFDPGEGDTVTNLRGQHFTCFKVRAIAPHNEPILYIATLT